MRMKRLGSGGRRESRSPAKTARRCRDRHGARESEPDRADARQAVESVKHQRAHGHEPVPPNRDIDERCIGRVEDQAGDRFSGANRTATPLPSDLP
jgi:hypothetical protein